MREGTIAGLLLAALASCGAPTSPCEQVGRQKDAVVDAYCQGKADVCWFCKCRNQGEQVKVTVVGEDVSFSCVPLSDGPQADCEGAALEEAQACLANEASCVTDRATLDATSKCGATRL